MRSSVDEVLNEYAKHQKVVQGQNQTIQSKSLNGASKSQAVVHMNQSQAIVTSQSNGVQQRGQMQTAVRSVEHQPQGNQNYVKQQHLRRASVTTPQRANPRSQQEQPRVSLQPQSVNPKLLNFKDGMMSDNEQKRLDAIAQSMITTILAPQPAVSSSQQFTNNSHLNTNQRTLQNQSGQANPRKSSTQAKGHGFQQNFSNVVPSTVQQNPQHSHRRLKPSSGNVGNQNNVRNQSSQSALLLNSQIHSSYSNNGHPNSKQISQSIDTTMGKHHQNTHHQSVGIRGQSNQTNNRQGSQQLVLKPSQVALSLPRSGSQCALFVADQSGNTNLSQQYSEQVHRQNNKIVSGGGHVSSRQELVQADIAKQSIQTSNGQIAFMNPNCMFYTKSQMPIPQIAAQQQQQQQHLQAQAAQQQQTPQNINNNITVNLNLNLGNNSNNNPQNQSSDGQQHSQPAQPKTQSNSQQKQHQNLLQNPQPNQPQIQAQPLAMTNAELQQQLYNHQIQQAVQKKQLNQQLQQQHPSSDQIMQTFQEQLVKHVVGGMMLQQQQANNIHQNNALNQANYHTNQSNQFSQGNIIHHQHQHQQQLNTTIQGRASIASAKNTTENNSKKGHRKRASAGGAVSTPSKPDVSARPYTAATRSEAARYPKKQQMTETTPKQFTFVPVPVAPMHVFNGWPLGQPVRVNLQSMEQLINQSITQTQAQIHNQLNQQQQQNGQQSALGLTTSKLKTAPVNQSQQIQASSAALCTTLAGVSTSHTNNNSHSVNNNKSQNHTLTHYAHTGTPQPTALITPVPAVNSQWSLQASQKPILPKTTQQQVTQAFNTPQQTLTSNNFTQNGQIVQSANQINTNRIEKSEMQTSRTNLSQNQPITLQNKVARQDSQIGKMHQAKIIQPVLEQNGLRQSLTGLPQNQTSSQVANSNQGVVTKPISSTARQRPSSSYVRSQNHKVDLTMKDSNNYIGHQNVNNNTGFNTLSSRTARKQITKPAIQNQLSQKSVAVNHAQRPNRISSTQSQAGRGTHKSGKMQDDIESGDGEEGESDSENQSSGASFDEHLEYDSDNQLPQGANVVRNNQKNRDVVSNNGRNSVSAYTMGGLDTNQHQHQHAYIGQSNYTIRQSKQYSESKPYRDTIVQSSHQNRLLTAGTRNDYLDDNFPSDYDNDVLADECSIEGEELMDSQNSDNEHESKQINNNNNNLIQADMNMLVDQAVNQSNKQIPVQQTQQSRLIAHSQRNPALQDEPSNSGPKELSQNTNLQRQQQYHDDDEEVFANTEGLFQDMVNQQQELSYYHPVDPYVQDCPVYLQKSVFLQRESTVFFCYPPQAGKQRPIHPGVFKMKEGKYKLRFKVSDSTHTYNSVQNALGYAGFAQTDTNAWNVLWSAPLKPENLEKFDPYKHCNHFAGTWNLGRKDFMYRHINTLQREFGADFNFCPKTWILPFDYQAFQTERKESEGLHKLWILKPANAACGNGIRLINRRSRIPKNTKDQYVVSKYLMRPHLIHSHKYDMRIYVLVTSYDPLTIYIYQEGLVRFATQAYSTKHKGSRFCHLTNFSVNKKSKNFNKPKRAGEGAGEGEEENSSKWSLSTLRAWFTREGLDFETIWVKIKDMIIKALISVEHILAYNLSRAGQGRRLCFEVFGFDVILDHNLRPWLLEINVLPSLSSSSELDKRIKTSLMSDTFNVIGVTPYHKKTLEKNQANQRWKRFVGLTKGFDDSQPGYQTTTTTLVAPSLEQSQSTANNLTNSFAVQNTNNDTELQNRGKGRDSSDDRDNMMANSNSQPQLQTYAYGCGEDLGKIRQPKEILSMPNKFTKKDDESFSREEQLIVVELIEEYMRRGNWDLIFPRKHNVEQYKKYFKVPRSPNLISWRWLKMNAQQRMAFLKDFKVRRTLKEVSDQLIAEL